MNKFGNIRNYLQELHYYTQVMEYEALVVVDGKTETQHYASVFGVFEGNKPLIIIYRRNSTFLLLG